jgi:hypothetical protein
LGAQAVDDFNITIANVNELPTGNVALSGTATQGQLLTASNTLADIDGLGAISYQWKANGVNIAGATNTSFVLTQAQVGKAITVAASYTDGFGFAESVTSTASAAVANINDLPTGGVSISGNANQGALLTAANTLADADGLGTISYQWKADGVNISAATNSTLLLSAAQIGQAISVTASYTDGFGTAESVTSAATDPVGDVQMSVQGMAYHWKSHMLLGQVNLHSPSQSGLATSTATPGTFELAGIASSPVALSASRGAGDTGSAITSADALAALRIATGVNPNPDPDGAGPQQQLKLSPYQVMAADVNKDGKVTSADALAILRMATNHATALPKEWYFVKETQDLWNETTNSSALTRQAANWDSGLGSVALSSGANSLNLVGVLKGDVNGSWSAPAGSIDLDNTNPNYFQLLGAQLTQPTDVWGV